jgi:hypothetical protein
MLHNKMHFLNLCFNSIFLVFYMFRTPYVHHQEDYIVHAALYGMFSMNLCKQSSRLLDKRQAFPNRIMNQHVTSKIGKYVSR